MKAPIFTLTDPGVMPGCHAIAAGGKDFFQQPAEFDPGIADNAGIGSFACKVTLDEVVKNHFLEFSCKINDGKRDIQVCSHLFYTVDLLVKVRLSQGHEKAMDGIAHFF